MAEFDIRRVPDGDSLADAHAVRTDVFIDEQGVSEDVEMDGKDNEAHHVIAYDGEEPVATARTRIVDDETAKVERVAVLKSCREQGLGRRVMDAIENLAREKGATRAVLHGQTTVEEFYHELDYETTSDVFYEADIPHVEMEKSL